VIRGPPCTILRWQGWGRPHARPISRRREAIRTGESAIRTVQDARSAREIALWKIPGAIWKAQGAHSGGEHALWVVRGASWDAERAIRSVEEAIAVGGDSHAPAREHLRTAPVFRGMAALPTPQREAFASLPLQSLPAPLEGGVSPGEIPHNEYARQSSCPEGKAK
jgi:hypothetical protein